jgi:Transposase DDE domain group 1
VEPLFEPGGLRTWPGAHERLAADFEAQVVAAHTESEATGKPARWFKDSADLHWQAGATPRRVIGKAKWAQSGANPRLVVTSLPAAEPAVQSLYETIHCARGEIENRIKERQLDLFADRTSAGDPCGPWLAIAMASACPWQHEFGLAHAMLRRARA